MYEPGMLILFESVDNDEEGLSRFYLKYLDCVGNEIKMEGGLPSLWRVKKGSVIGPDIEDGEIRYRITRVNKKEHLVWMTPHKPFH
ncbi:MAG TPA: hypothetical protein VHR47_13465 [Bacillota bacterium]|nr:hypothetical protein [Bacillota bacterium]